jgi:hypothetical protein
MACPFAITENTENVRSEYYDLAFQFGVGTKTPSWSTRSIYYTQSVIDGEKIQNRINSIGKCVYTMKELEMQENNQIKEPLKLQEIQNQEITFNEKQNSGDFNETPITEINLNNSCSECTGTIKSTDPISEKQLTENYLKIGGIAAVGVGILLLYTRRNKK